MSCKLWAARLLTVAAFTAGASTARAGNAFRVTGETVPASGISGEARTVTLQMTNDDAETVDVWGRRGGWAGGGWGRGGWGWNRGWGGGWAVNRGWGWNRGWNGGWVVNRGWGWNRGWGGVWVNRGWGPVWVPQPIFIPIYVNSSPFYDYPISIGGAADNGNEGSAPPQAQPFAAPPNGIYPYDGGPRNPVPLPKPDDRPAPMGSQGKVITASATTLTKFAYPAYGETPSAQRATGFAADRR